MNEENVEVKDKKKSALSVASLTLGIISIVTALFWYISLPTGIMAMIFGAKTIRRLGSKLGKAGLITGIVGTSICVLIYLSLVFITIVEVFC